MSKETIICVGYSRLPSGMAAQHMYGAMGFGLEIDTDTHEIVSVSATFITSMCNHFVYEIFKGHNLKEGIEGPVKKFEKKYYGMGKKAIIAAINDAYNQYLLYLETIE